MYLMCTDLSMDSNSKDVLVLTSYWHTEHSFCGGGLSIPTCENEEHSPVFHASGSSQSFGRRCYRSSTSMTSTSFTGSGPASFCKLLELKFFLVTSCNYLTIWQKKHIEVMTKAARLTTAHCSNWLKVLSIVILAFLLCHPNITQKFEGSHGTRGILMEFKCWSNVGILFAMHLKKTLPPALTWQDLKPANFFLTKTGRGGQVNADRSAFASSLCQVWSLVSAIT
jgi:hypothetical protein